MLDPLQLPALGTPPGVVSLFPTTRSDEQAWYYVCVTLCTVVPGSLVLLRLYTKVRIVRKVDVIDGLAVSSFLFLIALLVCGGLCISEGAGVHQWNLPMHNYIGVLYWLNVVEIIYAPTIFSVKTAILLQYLRLFAPLKDVNPFMWYSARIIIIVTAIYYTISTLISIFLCSPREAIWDPLITDARCLDNEKSILITCIFNIVSDMTILILPAKAVWKLQIPTRKKVGIVLLFSIGLFACIANAMIIFYVSRLGGANADVSYNTAWQGLWLFAEISFGIIVICTLLLPKFLEAKGAKLRGIFSSLTRTFASFGSGGSFSFNMRSSKDKAGSCEATVDSVVMVGSADSETASTDGDRDIEMYPSSEGVHDPGEYASNTADPSNGF